MHRALATPQSNTSNLNLTPQNFAELRSCLRSCLTPFAVFAELRS